jgi:putative transposase
MIDRNHDLPVSRQAKERGISRGCVYYLPRATSAAFAGLLITNGIRISMDGKGVWRDNVFPGSSPGTERVWKSVKYEEVYLKACANVPEARASIGKHLDFQNGRRPHQSLGRQTPDQARFNALQPFPVAV